ncbi:conjugal transfer protein [Streptomyces sp. NPDC059786]|uniref:conjugal transfer protein n=1 Tax=Streptomyces sp. NPDC059786 TaxID=3346946 RepID=UPI003656CB29
MAVPPQGDAPNGGVGGRRPGGQPEGGRATPALTEEMLIRGAGQDGRPRKLFGRRKAAEPAAPANPWVTGGDGGQGRPANGTSRLPGDGGDTGPATEQLPRGGQKAGKKRKGGKEEEPPSGNGWFHNPFAKPKAGSSAADRAGVSSAQMWAGPRRGILFRRFLGVFGVLLLLFLFVKLNGKASKTQVQAEVDAAVKASEQDFPRGAAVMWAAPLVKLFATYDTDHAEDRSRALQPYTINGLDKQLGWNGEGEQAVIDLVMSEDVVTSGKSEAVVRGTVQVDDGSWRCVAVPLFTTERGGATAFGLSATPVYVPCAGLTSPPKDTQSEQQNDTDLARELTNELLPPFLAAWAQSDTVNLERYLLPGSQSFGLGGAYTGAEDGGRPTVDDVYVPVAGKGANADRRTVTFSTTLVTADGKAAQTSTYRVDIAKRNGQWYFAGDPSPAVGSVGGDQVPAVQPSEGTGDMYSHSPDPYPSATTSTATQQPSTSASATP